MDKRVIFAVAGSGKTHYIINLLNSSNRFLIVTYTNVNYENIKARVVCKFGFIPNNIKILTFFDFLYNFCFKTILYERCRPKGINFKPNPNSFEPMNSIRYYKDPFGRFYSNRISKLICESSYSHHITDKISKYFDYFLIDEVQDIAGNDFNLLQVLMEANMNQIYVGDFYQHTFDTSRDGKVNQNLHKDFVKYQNKFRNRGMEIDTKTLSSSYRCSPTICGYITEKLQISIDSHRQDETSIIYEQDINTINDLKTNNDIVKLFFKESHNYNFYSNNWGKVKGEDKYQDVCIVLNDTTLKHFKKDKLQTLPPSTRNKLYVALSRAKGDVYLVPYNLLPAC